MKEEDFHRYVETISKFIADGNLFSEDVLHTHLGDLPTSTSFSLFSHIYVEHIKKIDYLMKNEESIAAALEEYEKGATIVEVALSRTYSPCLLARLLIPVIVNCTQPEVTKLMKAPALIPDARLRDEVRDN